MGRYQRGRLNDVPIVRCEEVMLMKWTSKPPTKPGLYWFALLDSDGVRRHCEVFLAEFGKYKGKACIWGGDGGVHHLASIPHRVWCGPLAPPTGKATHDSGVPR